MYISLGGNCSIGWQLAQYNLRSESYPFDWVKIKINQLINILENNFNDYVESLQIKKYSQAHESYILTNSYSVQFAHELVKDNDLNDLNNLKNKLINRINRFCNLPNEHIIFLRIELEPIKSNYIEKINKLVQLLGKYTTNFIIKIILESKSYDQIKDNLIPQIQFIKYDSFSSDWKMNHVCWKEILSLNS
jgi:DNA replicative helicase MCM subunit Mcm2 (Cdc46/Mcm family)